MKKRMLATIMTLGIAGALVTGCGFSASYSSTTTTTTTSEDGSSVTTTTSSSQSSSNGSHSKTETTETTTTDADGNTTTVTTTDDGNGTVTNYDHAAFKIVNDTDFDIAEMYVNYSGAALGEEMLAMTDNEVLPVGYDTGDCYTFSYDSDHTMIEITVVDKDGIPATFENVDLSGSTDPSNIKIDLGCGEEAGTYTATVC